MVVEKTKNAERPRTEEFSHQSKLFRTSGMSSFADVGVSRAMAGSLAEDIAKEIRDRMNLLEN
jgi:hypothetical protein